MATGVLAVQGAFVEHEHVLERLGESCIELRCAEDLEQPFDRLVLPGGESTAQGRLLVRLGMLEPLRERVQGGMPVLATCAGLILLARSIVGEGGPGEPLVPRIGTLDVLVRRNSYGRQLGSFFTTAELEGLGEVPMTFIRAPHVAEVGLGVEVLARVGGRIVAVRQGSQLAVAFHPELSGDTRVHELFLSMEGAGQRWSCS